MKHGKKYRASAEKVDRTKFYTLDEATALVKEAAFAKFDETVEVHIKLTLKKSQSVRDTVVLPHQFSAQKRVLVFAKGEKADEARAAGATYVGDDDLIEQIRKGWMDFDVAVATPDMMKDVGRLGPILGRRGLMPNPKTQTVTNDITGALAELMKGRVEFRSDRTGVVHLAVGKVSMDPAHVKENTLEVVREVIRKKPADAKGDYLASVTLASTMGPGVRIDVRDLSLYGGMKMDYKTRITPAKEEAVQALMDEFKAYDGFIFADYRGMTVEQITKLRRNLREKDAAFRVVKNRFAKIALTNMDMESDEHLTGPTAIALAKGDGANLVAKDLFNIARDGAPIKVKGALIDGMRFDAAQIEAFSKLPTRLELISSLMGTMKAPVQKLAATLLAYVKEKGGDAVGAAKEE